jgi:5-methyltetrahydropteroyltriglutamate--homocysteine methyltransferase
MPGGNEGDGRPAGYSPLPWQQPQPLVRRRGYDAIVEKLFNQLDIDVFLLEYDSARAGTFEALRFVPRNKGVALGLVSTKTPKLEARDDLLRRIDEASRYVPTDNLALSP